MSHYKDHIKKLQSEIESLRYFQDERLKLLDIGFRLQIINRTIEDISNDANEFIDLVNIVNEAKNNYDTMFLRYEQATIKLEKIRNESMALCEYTLDLEKQIKANQEL